MPKIEITELYEITVNPTAIPLWRGLFIFKPDVNDVAAVIRCEMDGLNPDVEHEFEDIRWLSNLLELVTFQQQLLGEVRIAGQKIGVITSKSIEAFVTTEGN
jgi:hypothetical protein